MIRKKLDLFSIHVFFASIVFAQNKGQIDLVFIPVFTQHYQLESELEYNFDVSTDPTAWLREKPGLHIAFVSADKLYFRTELPDIKDASSSLQATA